MNTVINDKVYESPKLNLLNVEVEGVLCYSLNNGYGNDDMPSEDLGDIFGW